MSVSWREICGGANNWTLAGQRDTPPTSRGDAVAAFVQFASQAINQMSLNHRIEEELARLESAAEAVLARSSPGFGVVAVVSYYAIRHPDGQVACNFRSVGMDRTAYLNPNAAMQRRDTQAAQFGTVRAGSTSPAVTPQNRYFWGTYTAPPPDTLESRVQRYGGISAMP